MGAAHPALVFKINVVTVDVVTVNICLGSFTCFFFFFLFFLLSVIIYVFYYAHRLIFK